MRAWCRSSKMLHNSFLANEDQAWQVMGSHRFIRAMETNWKDLSKITFHCTVHQLGQPPMRNAWNSYFGLRRPFYLRLNRANEGWPANM